jgi:hypothetical protein
MDLVLKAITACYTGLNERKQRGCLEVEKLRWLV